VNRAGDTVAAISTPPGEGGIGIIRISGSGSKAILKRIFRVGRAVKLAADAGAEDAAAGSGAGEQEAATRGSAGAGVKTGAAAKTEVDMVATKGAANAAVETEGGVDFENRRMYYGHVVTRDGEIVDEVLAVFMAEPRTYTGEDVVEIHCHGSLVALRRGLKLILEEGARPAEPGEFTKRAFLNGRLDLSQAEAVIDLIKAKTEKTFDAAIRQLDGSLSIMMKSIRGELTDILADIAADLDYPEEDEARLDSSTLIERLSAVCDELEKLKATAGTGKILNEGLKAVITGKPNVGKSSLMNALLGEPRVIVADTPGTTRDVIEEGADIDGIHVRFFDTAGIRKTEDSIEKIGVDRSKDAFNNSDLVLLVLDRSRPLDDEDVEIMRHIGGRPIVVLMNKADLGDEIPVESLKELLPEAVFVPSSMTDGSGLAELKCEIANLVYQGRAVHRGSVILTNARQEDAVDRALTEMDGAVYAMKVGESLDLVEIPIRSAWEFLGEITGESAAEEIIDRVFAKFCLGK
jgi:tRNA modification GTPase